MQLNGAIKVQLGDWLSKYSAAIHDDFTHVDEFARKDRTSNSLLPIHNVNLIIAGETIYHKPTHRAYKQSHALHMDEQEIGGFISDEQKTKIIVDTLKNDNDLQGVSLELVETAAHGTEWTDSGVKTATILGELAGWSADCVATSVLEYAALAATPIAAGIGILNATKREEKIAGMQAIGFALTAWVFGDEIPSYPPKLAVRYTRVHGKTELISVQQAWKAASDAIVRNLEAEAVKKRRSKESYQLYWQTLGGFDRMKLIQLMTEVRAEELSEQEKPNFWGLSCGDYPPYSE